MTSYTKKELNDLELRKSRLSYSEMEDKVIPSNFIVDFPLMCIEENILLVPEVVIEVKKPFSATLLPQVEASLGGESELSEKSCPPVTPVVEVAFEVPGNQDTLHHIIFKGLRMESAMLRAFQRCVPAFPSVAVLRVENCHLTSNMLELLVSCLVENRNIQEISLDMNPILEQNYFRLLEEETGLLYLSLRHCKIDDFGLSLLAKELSFKEPLPKLLYLNLTCNRITAEGARCLCQALRSNRSLRALSLAGNFIGDGGATGLAEVLQMFPLTHEEVVCRRQHNFAWISKRNALVQERLLNMKNVGGASKSDKAGPTKKKEGRMATAREKKRSPGKDAKTTTSAAAKAAAERSYLEQLVEQEMQPDPYPYMRDSILDGGEIWCLGNLKLAHLNIGYNCIDMPGLTNLFQAVKYQNTLDSVLTQNMGITNIAFEGNPSFDTQMLKDMLEILAIRTGQIILPPPKELSVQPSLKASSASRRKIN